MAAAAKQSPRGKAHRAQAADGRTYFSYAQIAETVASTVPAVKAFNPDVMVAIGGGGFIPARMLRTEVRVPILAVSLELYNDATATANDRVLLKQWFDESPDTFGALVRGGRVLVVDEVDDSRATLEYAVGELVRRNAPAAVAVLVVHNKDKAKKGKLPDGATYIAGETVPNSWNCYPWDAAAYGRDVREHEALARRCAGEADTGAAAAASSSSSSSSVIVPLMASAAVAAVVLAAPERHKWALLLLPAVHAAALAF